MISTLVLGGFLTLNCGGGNPPSSPSSPAPGTPGTPSPSLPDLNGGWSGTLESLGVPPRRIAAFIIQQADCVDGSWNTVSPSESRWVGAISAFALPATLDGFMSFEFPVGSRLCTGIGTIVGDATSDAVTLTWTITEHNTQTCTSGVPTQFIVRLQRDR